MEGEGEPRTVPEQARLLGVDLGEESFEGGGDLCGIGAIEDDLEALVVPAADLTGDLLAILAQKHDGSNGSRPIDPGSLLKKLVGVALAFELEPTAAEAPFGVASSCLPSLEVGDKPYLKFSPISLVGNVTTPTLLMTGDADLRTPLSEAEQFFHALKLRRIDTGLVRIPGASHNIVARPSQLIAKVAHVLAWFEKYRR